MSDENQMIHPARSGGDRHAALDARSLQPTKTCLLPSATVLTLTQGCPGFSGTWVDHRRLTRASAATVCTISVSPTSSSLASHGEAERARLFATCGRGPRCHAAAGPHVGRRDLLQQELGEQCFTAPR